MQPSVAASDKQVCANSTKCYKEMLCVLTQEDNWRRSFCKTGQAGAEGKRPVKRYLKAKMISPVTSLLAALVEGKLLKLVCEQMNRWCSDYFYMKIITQKTLPSIWRNLYYISHQK